MALRERPHISVTSSFSFSHIWSASACSVRYIGFPPFSIAKSLSRFIWLIRLLSFPLFSRFLVCLLVLFDFLWTHILALLFSFVLFFHWYSWYCYCTQRLIGAFFIVSISTEFARRAQRVIASFSSSELSSHQKAHPNVFRRRFPS